jgi:hypothetical protein
MPRRPTATPIWSQIIAGYALNLGPAIRDVAATVSDTLGSVTTTASGSYSLGAVSPGLADPIASQILAQINGNPPAYGPISLGSIDGVITDRDNTHVPSSSPYTITAPVSSPSAFLSDLGVAYSGGAAFTRVMSLTGAGQYTFASGVYTFDNADAGAPIVITYTVTDPVTMTDNFGSTRDQLGVLPPMNLGAT